MSRFDLKPDPGSPVPLYHQIAEALRYRIATGAIAIGAVLPPLREAARLWGVNLHTVRRAYAELAEAGIVQTRAPLGTQVLPAAVVPPQRGASPAERRGGRLRAAFLHRVIEEARERHGLSLEQLLALLESHRPLAGRIAGATVHVAECSATQSADLARQLEERWRVHAVPWPIDRPEPPAPGAVVATYFHYNDLRLRWPRRFDEIRFAAIGPDPGLGRQLVAEESGGTRAAGGAVGRGPRRGGTGAKRITVLLCEREESMLRNIAADVSRILPAGRFHIVTKLVRRPATLLDGVAARTRVLVAPRIWGDLPNATRDDRRVHELRYIFDSKDLDLIGRDLGWAPREEV